ncbi:MAG: Gldg family protein [Verrucomicrobiota bacterium]|jgi:ABC-type uncharacterized transport system involved in gliding motility auxiliary subunit
MTTSKHKWEPLFYSGIGVAAMFLILVAVGIIAGAAKVRLDLTAERVYTLSDGTRKVLGKLDTPVEIHFFCTQSGNDMPVSLKAYAKHVEDLLDEYRQVSSGRITVKKFDPQPDSDAEDLARLDGVEGQVLGGGEVIGLGEKVYLGLAVICLDQKQAVPFLDPARERLLEYDLTRAIGQVINPQKPVLGVMSGLPVFGQMNPMMARMGQQGQEPWVAITELQRDFTVKQLELNVDKIDDSINVLLVIHPANITDRTQFALDQFVLRGGKLIAFLDPLSVVDSRNAGNMQNMLQRAASGGSSLDKLLKAWGLDFDVSKVVADKNYVTPLRRGDGEASPEPTWLSLTPTAIDRSDVVTAQIDSLLLPFPGVFTGTPVAGLKETVLLKTSGNSMLVDKMMVQFGGGSAIKDFVPSGKEYALAVRLTGKFKTAFPGGKPPGAADSKDEEDKAKDDKAKEATKTDKKDDSLKESQKDGLVVLVGDTDLLYDQFAVRIQNFFGQRLASPFNGNLNFLQNVVEQMMGDSNLIAVRSRAVQSRPFTRVKEIQAQAEEQYRTRIAQLTKDLEDAQQKLGELEQNKDKNQRYILSPEQQAEIKRFHDKEAQAKRDLKQVRKQLRKDIDSLETRLKWVNIAGMPFLVTVAGISLALLKRKQTAAK